MSSVPHTRLSPTVGNDLCSSSKLSALLLTLVLAEVEQERWRSAQKRQR